MTRLTSRRGLAALAALGSGALLLGALGFQHVGGLAPCMLCLVQRWPHLLAVFAGAVSLWMPRGFVLLAGALGALGSAAVGIFHTGVERGWWEGLSSCTGGLDLSKLTPEEAYQAILAAPVVRCDEVAWQMMGLSMASWNAVISLGLAAIWISALRKS